MPSRRKFIQNSAILFSAGSLAQLGVNAQEPRFKKTNSLVLGVAGYTFLKYSLEQALGIMKRTGIQNLSIKDFHLPLNSDQQKIGEVKQLCKQADVNLYTVGVIYMKSKEEVDRAFDYAKRVGVNMIVGVPGYNLLEYTEQKVKEYNIKMAIHNHGPEDKLYPGPKDVYDRIKNMDSRMGLCLDIGHALRAGTDLSKSVKMYAPRIFDLHVKDVTAAQADAKVTEVGRGAIDFPSLVKTLKSVGFNGVCSIEYEKNMDDVLPGIAESAGYFRGVDKAL